MKDLQRINGKTKGYLGASIKIPDGIKGRKNGNSTSFFGGAKIEEKKSWGGENREEGSEERFLVKICSRGLGGKRGYVHLGLSRKAKASIVGQRGAKVQDSSGRGSIGP